MKRQRPWIRTAGDRPTSVADDSREDDEMRRLLVSFLFCLWPLFWGVLLPYVQFPGGLRLLNLFWSVVCGLGLWTIDETVGLSIVSPLLVLGVLVWPIAVSGAMFLLGWKLRQMSSAVRLVLICALLASSLAIVSVHSALQPPMSGLPTYYRQFAAIL